MSLYFLINILSISIPLIVSFDKRIQLIKDWKSLLISLSLCSIPFIIWDIYFTRNGYWGFNSMYLSNHYIFDLPFEEIMFFICIPFACIFTHISILKIRPYKLSKTYSKPINFFINICCISLLVLNIHHAYTVWVMISVLVIQNIAQLFFKDLLRHYYITFLFMIIPFLLVNGILTGSLIEEEIVWYNNYQNLGIRIATIPIEDFFYAYSLILVNIIMFKIISKNKFIEYND